MELPVLVANPDSLDRLQAISHFSTSLEVLVGVGVLGLRRCWVFRVRI